MPRTQIARRSLTRPVVQKKARAKKVALSRLQLNPTVRKLVDRRINKSQETNHRQWPNIYNVNVDGAISGPDIYPLISGLNIPHGVESDERSGDKVKLVSFKLHIWLRSAANLSEADANTFVARLMVFTPKRYNYDELTTAAKADVAAKLLNSPSGDADIDFNGHFSGLHFPINSRKVTRHYDKTFTRIGPVTYNSYDGSPGNGYAAHSHDTPVWFRRVTIALKVKNKILKFPEGSDYPANFNPCLALGFVNTNLGLNPDTSTRINISCQTEAKWKNL